MNSRLARFCTRAGSMIVKIGNATYRDRLHCLSLEDDDGITSCCSSINNTNWMTHPYSNIQDAMLKSLVPGRHYKEYVRNS